MEKWLEKQRQGEWGALRTHTDILLRLIQDQLSAETAAKQLVESVMSAEKPADDAYRFCQLVLNAAAEFAATHEPITALLQQIRNIPSSTSNPNKALFEFNMYLRDKLDSLHERRYFKEPEETSPGSASGSGTTPSDRWINYNAFFAHLVLSAGFAPDGSVFGFFRLRDILEYHRSTLEQKRKAVLDSTTYKAAPIPAPQLIECDLLAALRWVTPALYATSNRVFGPLWVRGIAVPTELWTGGEEQPGLSEGRWRLWKDRLEHFAESEDLRPEVKKAVVEGAKAIEGFGSGHSSSSLRKEGGFG